MFKPWELKTLLSSSLHLAFLQCLSFPERCCLCPHTSPNQVILFVNFTVVSKWKILWKFEMLMENSWEIGVSAEAEHGREQRKEGKGKTGGQEWCPSVNSTQDGYSWPHFKQVLIWDCFSTRVYIPFNFLLSLDLYPALCTTICSLLFGTVTKRDIKKK